MIKTDCFAYRETTKNDKVISCGCYSLNELFCKNQECRFYKPKSEITINEIEAEIKGFFRREA